jgi:hypothetical protein
VGQLQKYKKLLSQNGDDIITGYKEQLNIYNQLRGSFFKQRARNLNEIALYPHARLIITGFDASQMDMLHTIRKEIEKGVGWKEGSKELIATGDFKSLTKSNRLFLGLQ